MMMMMIYTALFLQAIQQRFTGKTKVKLKISCAAVVYISSEVLYTNVCSRVIRFLCCRKVNKRTFLAIDQFLERRKLGNCVFAKYS